jgi:hypothetical protein
MRLPTLYKARGVPTKQVVCAICVDRTRGKTQPVRLRYGVVVQLCAGHADPAFLRARGGRDFVLTLQRLWTAHNCMTEPRCRALVAHLELMRDHAPPKRRRPGSYTWPIQRRQAEQAFANGASPRRVHERLKAAVHSLPINPPSSRTIHRWHAQHRWLSRTPPEPGGT